MPKPNGRASLGGTGKIVDVDAVGTEAIKNGSANVVRARLNALIRRSIYGIGEMLWGTNLE